jgi:nucleoside-diphosphate-sugar epimerase
VKPAAFVSEKVATLLGKTATFNSDKYLIMKQRNWSCDITPLKNDIGFIPRWRLKEGIEMTAEWYKKEGWL